MRAINELTPELQQTFIKLTNNDNKLKIAVKQNSFTAGYINFIERVFYNAFRSPKNLFYLFGSPALGLNAELLNIILPHFNIDRIIIPYQGDDLEITVTKWRDLGIVSPYCNQAVDKQIMLSLDKINLDNSEPAKMIIPDNQLSFLFGSL